jgi:hypothetical protein
MTKISVLTDDKRVKKFIIFIQSVFRIRLDVLKFRSPKRDLFWYNARRYYDRAFLTFCNTLFYDFSPLKNSKGSTIVWNKLGNKNEEKTTVKHVKSRRVRKAAKKDHSGRTRKSLDVLAS